MVAKVKVLVKGFINLSDKSRGCGWSSIVLIRDGKKKIIVDPGTVHKPKIILDSLKKENLTVNDITHVFITHSHLDHYRYLGMFPKAIAVDFWGNWDKEYLYFNEWSNTYSRSKGNFSENIHIVKTPGHDPTCLTFFVKGEAKLNNQKVKGIIGICGDVFWKKNFPKLEEEPFATNKSLLKKSRDLVIKHSDYIIPGHDDLFKVEK